MDLTGIRESSDKYCMNFDEIVGLDAVQSLERSRSQTLLKSLERQRIQLQREINQSQTVWDIQPIDFSAKLYQPGIRPTRARGSLQGNNNLQPRTRRTDNRIPVLKLPSLLKQRPVAGNSKDPFVTNNRPSSPQSSRIDLLPEGILKKDAYFTDSGVLLRRDIFRPVILFICYSLRNDMLWNFDI